MLHDVEFPVAKIPVKDILPAYDTMPGISHAIVRTDTKKILSYRSEDYALIKNSELIQKFSEFLHERKFNFNLHTQNYRDVRFKLSFILENHKREISKGDIVAPEFFVKNSYNGSQRYQFGVGVMRLVCTNGLSIMVDEKKLDMLHTPQADDGVAVEKSLQLIHEFLPEYEEALDPFYELVDNPVPDILLRMEEVVESTQFPIGLMEGAVQRAQKERDQFKLEPTDWLIYNALNFMINQSETLMGRKGDNVDRQVLEYLLAY